MATGGFQAYVGGPRAVGEAIRRIYAAGGAREFDSHFMAQDVYERTFAVVVCEPDQVPAEQERSQPLGRHLDGYRIGFDLGPQTAKSLPLSTGRPSLAKK